jgi:O-antigen/teichoic acid export membrane protein
MLSRSKLNFSKILMGHVGAQLISFAFYPILTRIYEPDDFGVFGFFNSIVQITAIYSTGQLHVGMLSFKDDDSIRGLFSASLVLNFLISTLILFVLSILYFYGLIELIYLLVPVGVFLYGSLEIVNNWAVSRDVLGLKGVLVNVNRLCSNVLKLFGSTSLFLVISELIANSTSLLFFMTKCWRDFVLGLKSLKIVDVLQKNKSFPLFFTFYVLSQVLSSEAVTIYLKRYLSSSEVGIFFLANKLFVQTALIVSSSLSFAFNHLLIEGHDKRQQLYSKVMKIYIVGLFLSVALWFPNYSSLIRLLFGGKWIDLENVINYFFFLSPVKLLVGFCAYIILLSGKMKFIAIFKIAQFLGLYLALQTGFSDLEHFLKIFVPLEVFFDSVFIIWGYQLVKSAN